MIKYKMSILALSIMFAYLGCSCTNSINNTNNTSSTNSIQTFKFPKENDFSLTAEFSNKKPKLGEEFEVEATFLNTNSKIKIEHGRKLISIDVAELGKTESVTDFGIALVEELKPKEEIIEKRKIKIDKKGKYEIYAHSNFYIKDPKTNEEKHYVINSDRVIIEIK